MARPVPRATGSPAKPPPGSDRYLEPDSELVQGSVPRNATLFATVYALGWILPPGGWLLVREALLLTKGLYRNA